MQEDGWISGRSVPPDLNGPVDVRYDPIGSEWLDRSPIARFDYIAAAYPDRLAIDDGQTQLTYSELRRAAMTLAVRIDQQVPEGMPILAVLSYSALVPVALLASIAASRPIIPVDAAYPEQRQQMIVDHAGAAVVLAETGSSLFIEAKEIPLLHTDIAELLTGSEADWPLVSYDPRALGGVIFTSGSTGSPRGFAWSLGAIMRMISEKTDMFHLNESDKLIAIASHSAAGLGDVLFAVLNGAALRILDIMKAGLNEALRVLGDERITIFNFVPAVLRAVLSMEEAPEAFRHLRILELYGDATPPEDVAFFRARLPRDCHISTVFGSTESAVIFTWFVPRDFQTDEGGLPIGYLTRDKSVRIIDELGRPVEQGSEGELVVKSRLMALGAWQHGGISSGPFLTDPDDAESKIYAMGDVVTARQDGLFAFRGRSDRMVKVRGLRADLAEIEAAMRQHPAICDVAAVALAQGSDNEIVAYCVANDGVTPPTRSDLRRTVGEATAPHMIPSIFKFIEQIPRLPNYKPDLVALARLAKERQ